MKVLSRKPLREFWEKHHDAEQPLKAWFAEAEKAAWQKPDDVKARYGSASIIANNRVVFNIGGNKYRLVAQINYRMGLVLIRFVGTHKKYDAIKAEVI